MERTENPSRERILGRIQDALRTPTAGLPAMLRKRVFPAVVEVLERFQRECATNITECVLTPDEAASRAAIADVLASLPPGEIFVQDAPELRRMASAWTEGRSLRWSSEGAAREVSQATVTLAEVLVAASGSILVSSGCGGRSGSIVAPVHIVMGKLEQLVPDLEAASACVRERDLAAKNSMLCLITGSSRTADIEKILVLGAHGPRRLVLVLQTGE